MKSTITKLETAGVQTSVFDVLLWLCLLKHLNIILSEQKCLNNVDLISKNFPHIFRAFLN